MYVNEGKCMKARNPTVLDVIGTLANMRKQVSTGMSIYDCLLDQISIFKWAG
jgi:hypothetical protein